MRKYGFLIFITLISFPFLIMGQHNIQNHSTYCSSFLSESTGTEKPLIRMRANLTYSTVSRLDGDDSFLFSEKCNNGDYFATVVIKASPKSLLSKSLEKLKPERDFVFEIEFLGKLNTSFFPSYGHLSWSRAEMEIWKIIRFKDVTKTVVNPNYEAETPMLAKAKELYSVNSKIIGNLVSAFGNYSNPESFENDSIISMNFFIYDNYGNKSNKANARRFMQNAVKSYLLKNDSYGVSASGVRKSGKFYIVNGRIRFGQSIEKGDKILYENQFSYSSGDWILESTKIILEK